MLVGKEIMEKNRFIALKKLSSHFLLISVRLLFFFCLILCGQTKKKQKLTAIIFVVPLSSYDEFLHKDNSTNALLDSIDMFSNVCNQEWFEKTAKILIFNNVKLFQEKIEKNQIRLNVCFPEYNRNHTYEDCYSYIVKKFIHQAKDSEKLLYIVQVCFHIDVCTLRML